MLGSNEPELPDGFLQSPAPSIKVARIDFTASGLPEYKDRYAVVLDDVLTGEECKLLLRAAEATSGGQWERAQINVGMGQQKLIEDARKCGRIIWDSRDIVGRIWRRIEQIPEVQEVVRLEHRPLIFGNGPAKRKEVWVATRPNERMRFLKYVGGEYFRAHVDGSYETPDRKERSYFTIHLYLNDAEEVQGGATVFHSMSMKPEKDFGVEPKQGRILLFQHRDLLHSGDDVHGGVKFTMRTDLMYALEGK